MSKIIILNGASSSGKTSIARAIQNCSDLPWLTFGIDTFIKMTPYPVTDHEGVYLSFLAGGNSKGVTQTIKLHTEGIRLFSEIPSVVDLFANKQHNLIIDEILLDDIRLKSYITKLSPYTVYFIGVYCDLSIMQQREFLRRNRAIGLANAQYDHVHEGLREYDLTVNTSVMEVFQIAKDIIYFMDNHKYPTSFTSMRKKLTV